MKCKSFSSNFSLTKKIGHKLDMKNNNCILKKQS